MNLSCLAKSDIIFWNFKFPCKGQHILVVLFACIFHSPIITNLSKYYYYYGQ